MRLMIGIHNFSGCMRAAAAMVAAWSSAAAAQYEPPAGYYNSATGTGAALKSQLRAITAKDYFTPGSTSQRVVSYSSAPEAFVVIDRDPNNSSNLVLVYTGASVSNVWDTVNLPWNREHTWPDSLGLGGGGPDYSDLHQLRPCNTQVNNNRGNLPFGTGGGYWDPNQGSPDRGDMARAMFYMDTRYDGADASTVDLSLVDGQPSGNQMGDLAKLLHWHYQDPPSIAEKRRNQLVFDKTLNPTYWQGNRNPYIDRPEFVWTIFGGGNNNSRLHVGAAPPGDGSSSMTVSLGRVMKHGAIGSASVTINKFGAHPTTFDVTVAGSATSSLTGSGHTFDYNAQTRNLVVGLSASTATAGPKSGSLTINNTELSSGGTGLGSADGNDVVSITARVLDNRVVHASAVDFGRVIGNKRYARTTALTTSGDDDHFTRVTVSGQAVTQGLLSIEAGASQLFDDESDQVVRTVSTRFRSEGLQGGIVPLAVSGEGLSGEAVQPVSVTWSALVMPGSSEGPLPPSNPALEIQFGDVQPASEQQRSFPVGRWLATGGIDPFLSPNPLARHGDWRAFAIDVSATSDGGADLLATLDASVIGRFDSTFTMGLSNGEPLLITLGATVVPEPSVAGLLIGLTVELTGHRRRPRSVCIP
jgi:endonuclease I